MRTAAILPCFALAVGGREQAFPRRLVRGARAVLTRCQIALETVRGSWPDDDLFGLPWLEWTENPATPAIVIEGEIRELLFAVPGVVEVLSVASSTIDDDLAIEVSLRVQDTGASTVVATLGSIGDPRTPGAWYLSLPTQPVVP